MTSALLSAPAQPSGLRHDVHRQLHELAGELLEPAGGDVWERRLRTRLQALEPELEAEPSGAEAGVAKKLYRQLRDRFERAVAANREAAEQERADQAWAALLGRVSRAESFSLPHVAHQTAELLREALAGAPSEPFRLRLRSLFVSLQQQLNAARNRPELAGVIVRHWMRHGGSVEQVRRLTVQLAAEWGDGRLLANEASLHWMAGDGGGAFQSWLQFLEVRPAPRLVAELPLTGIVCGEEWCAESCQAVEQELAERYPASLTIYSRERLRAGEHSFTEPRLYDPSRRREWSATGLIALSRHLPGASAVHAATTGPAPAALTGAAEVGYANLFHECGVPLEAAWGVATGLRPHDRVWRIDFYQPISAAARQSLRDLLKGALRAHVLVNTRPGESRPQPGLQGVTSIDQPFRGAILSPETFTESTAALAAQLSRSYGEREAVTGIERHRG